MTEVHPLGVLAQAVRILKEGGVVAYPTDTIYGLGADIFNVEAVERVFWAKCRQVGEGLPVLISTLADLEFLTDKIPPVLYSFAERFWPGPLTLVLSRHYMVPMIVTGGQNTVAVRLPRHPVPLGIISESGTPITGTSANRSGGPQPVTPDDVRGQLGNRVDMVIDGGRCVGAVPSTILDLTMEPPVVLRHGAISDEALKAVCPLGP